MSRFAPNIPSATWWVVTDRPCPKAAQGNPLGQRNDLVRVTKDALAMPNHLHGVIVIIGDNLRSQGRNNRVNDQRRPPAVWHSHLSNIRGR